MILADYRCGCTWVGKRKDCLTYCAKHGEDRRQIIPIGRNPKVDGAPMETGWDYQTDKQRDEARSEAIKKIQGGGE